MPAKKKPLKKPKKKSKGKLPTRPEDSAQGTDGQSPPLEESELSSVPIVPAEGNTKTSANEEKFVEHPVKSWCFTVYNYTDEMIGAMCAKCAEENIKYIFGCEICPTTNRPHLQCFISFGGDKKSRWRSVFKGILPESTNRRSCKGSDMANYDYCSKDQKYYTNIKVLNCYRKKEIVLRPWQAWVEERIHYQCENDRQILWIYDLVGNIGKNTLITYLKRTYGGVAISGKKRHILSVAFELPQTRLWMLDRPRYDCDAVPYGTLESLRNGSWMSGFGKNTGSIELDFNPVVCVFCNHLPEWGRMSADKWDVWEIVDSTPINRPVWYRPGGTESDSDTE